MATMWQTPVFKVCFVLLLSSCNAEVEFPKNFQLTAKQSGMMGQRSVYSLEATVGRVGPLMLLVDTGSPAVVVQGDFGSSPASSPSFLGVDNGGSATIHYGGSTVTGEIARSRMCLDDSTKKDFCLDDFPVFEVQQQDSGFSQLGLDGVLGLGPTTGQQSLKLAGMDETLLDGVNKAGSSAPRVFGLYVSPGNFYGQSTLSLGGYDSSKILQGAELEYVPLAQPHTNRWELALQSVKLAPADGSTPEAVDLCQGQGDCRALVDSGTAQIATAPQLMDSLAMKLRTSDSSDCVPIQNMPDLHIEFAGGVTVKLGPEDYVLDKGMCSLAIEELSAEELARSKSLVLILGEPFLRKVYAVFDQEQGRVGLAPSVAAQSQQTQNERRRQEQKEAAAEHGRATLMNYISR